MVNLTRTVRFSINPAPAPGGSADWGDAANTFAAFPTMRGLGRHYELDVCCQGEIDPSTGYFVNIKVVDAAVRTAAIPLIEQACRERPTSPPETILPDLLARLNAAMRGSVHSVRWRLSPYYCVEMQQHDTNRALIRQRFEFAASHRLHCAGLTDEQNRELFGKCNNPAGHGHNYLVEPCVEVSLDAPEPAFGLADIERLTQETIVRRFDHTHLNVDTPEFREGSGVNPSVENIAAVCFRLLEPAISRASSGNATLRSITVWETEKTSCTFPA
ncbi:MAG: 6-carboxytetrahydropterin synthase [Phycisphaeraceae bacterium]|nr:6-carboxytetrahydropterin synthase [Phycisphaeraceae bacterium]